MVPFSDESVAGVFEEYPAQVREKMLALRDLIYTTAARIGGAGGLKEELRWGEPSYLCRTGSTIRIHWKETDPEGYRVYFHCRTSLVATFRELYSDVFRFEGNRAIRLEIEEEPDLVSLGNCLETALKYHLVKGMPRLGLQGEFDGGKSHLEPRNR